MDPNTASGCESEIVITRTLINAMCDVWGIATKWHDVLKSGKVSFDVTSTVDILTEAGALSLCFDLGRVRT
jgi:hypothetical protein